MSGDRGEDRLRQLWRQRRTLAAITLAGTVGGGLYAVLAPKWFEAQLAVVPSIAEKMPISAAALAMGIDLPFDVGGGSSDADRIQAVLKSRSVTDAVIAKFGLRDVYGRSTMEDTRKDLWSHCASRIDKKPSVVTLTCEDKEPARAQAMAAFFGEVGNRTFVRVTTSSAAAERKFLEARVVQARDEMDGAAERLRAFQEQHKVIDLSEQSKAVVTAMAKLKGDLLAKQLELSYLDSFSSSDEATAVQLRQQVAILERKMKTLESSQSDAETPPARSQAKERSDGSDLFPAALSVPKLRFELEQLFRDQKIQETVFLMLTQRLETAKVNEARDTPAFSILDPPVLPTKRSRPKRLTVLLLGFFVGLGAALAWTLTEASRKRLRAAL